MPQPGQVEQLAAELLRLYASSWQNIDAEEQRILRDWPTARREARQRMLRELRAAVERQMDEVDVQALTFTQRNLPTVYALGAAAADLGAVLMDSRDQAAIASIADQTYSDLLAATKFVRESTKDVIRVLAKDHLADKVIRGQTAVQAARDLARALDGRGIAAVVYRDGSRHGLAEYADVVVRTASAQAYTVATINQIDRAGIEWVEILDGTGCGWTAHSDPDQANGSIRSLEEARLNPLSHPRCRRAVAPRPDVTSAREARQARSSVTPAQQADQTAAEVARQEAVVERAFRRRGGSFTDAGARVPSARHAAVLSRRAARLARRRTTT